MVRNRQLVVCLTIFFKTSGAHQQNWKESIGNLKMRKGCFQNHQLHPML
jgi:hypothetical protein